MFNTLGTFAEFEIHIRGERQQDEIAKDQTKGVKFERKAVRSVRLGKYCRNKRLVFSFDPRCQGLCGSQKYTATSVARVNRF